MLSNDAIANAVHHDLDLYFQGKKMSGNHIIFNVWKTVRVSEKSSSTTFIVVDIGHPMASLPMSTCQCQCQCQCHQDLDLYFQDYKKNLKSYDT